MMSLFLAMSLAVVLPVSARADDAEYERLKNVKTCITTLREADQRLGVILDTWFTGEQSAVAVASHFAVVQQQHQKFLDELDTYAKLSTVTPTNLEALAAAIAETEQPAPGVLRTRDLANEYSERFLLGLVSLDDGLNEVGGEFEAAGRVCPYGESEAQGAIARSLELVKSLRLELGRMRIFVAEAIATRLDLFGALLASRRITLYQAYAREAGQSLDAIRSAVEATLAADRFARRIENWWFAAAVTRGVGRGLTTRDLQYTEGLRKLRADAQTGREFEQELRQITGLPDGARRILEADLTLYLKQIIAEIDRVEAGGWRGMLERQKLLTSRRRAIAAQLNSLCIKEIAAFEQLAATVANADEARATELAYQRQLAACTGGGN